MKSSKNIHIEVRMYSRDHIMALRAEVIKAHKSNKSPNRNSSKKSIK